MKNIPLKPAGFDPLCKWDFLTPTLEVGDIAKIDCKPEQLKDNGFEPLSGDCYIFSHFNKYILKIRRNHNVVGECVFDVEYKC